MYFIPVTRFLKGVQLVSEESSFKFDSCKLWIPDFKTKVFFMEDNLFTGVIFFYCCKLLTSYRIASHLHVKLGLHYICFIFYLEQAFTFKKIHLE